MRRRAARCRVAGASHSSYRRYDPAEMATDEVPEAARVREAFPAILAAHPAVAAIIERSCLLLHGSTTIGMERPASDWDLWVLTDDATRAAFAAEHGTCFVEFEAARIGHFQVESVAAF